MLNTEVFVFSVWFFFLLPVLIKKNTCRTFAVLMLYVMLYGTAYGALVLPVTRPEMSKRLFSN